jgi:hypothetical protein
MASEKIHHTESTASPSHLSDVEKHNHDEHKRLSFDDHGFTTTQAALPQGYFRSSFFLGTMSATGLGLAAAVGGFGLAAPNLLLINADIGPDANIVWVSLVYTLTLAVGLILVGRLSDLFGRRVSGLRMGYGVVLEQGTDGCGSGSSSALRCSRLLDAWSARRLRVLVR